MFRDIVPARESAVVFVASVGMVGLLPQALASTAMRSTRFNRVMQPPLSSRPRA